MKQICLYLPCCPCCLTYTLLVHICKGMLCYETVLLLMLTVMITNCLANVKWIFLLDKWIHKFMVIFGNNYTKLKCSISSFFHVYTHMIIHLTYRMFPSSSSFIKFLIVIYWIFVCAHVCIHLYIHVHMCAHKHTIVPTTALL